MKTIITDSGLNAVVLAGTVGPNISITTVKIGSSILNPLSTMTDSDFTDTVWQGDSQYLTYKILDDSTFCYEVTLPESVGTFSVGNIRLYTSGGTLFSITTLLATEQKIAQGTGVVGNRLTYTIPIKLSGVSSTFDVSYMIASEGSIPLVDSQSTLPDYQSSTYTLYGAQTSSPLNLPCLALRTAQGWSLFYGTDPTQTTTPQATYFKQFSQSDIVDGKIAIPQSEHNLGSDVYLEFFQKQTLNSFTDTPVTFAVDLEGNVTLSVSELFDGRVLLRKFDI